MAAIIRSYMMYKPYVLFAWLTAVFGVLGLIPFVRYGVLWARDREDGHLQSLLVGALLLILAFMSLMLGVISDLIRTNRVLIEDSLEHTKRNRFRVPYPALTIHRRPPCSRRTGRQNPEPGPVGSVAATPAAAAPARDPGRGGLRLPAGPGER